MARLDIRIYGDEVLRKKTKFVKQFDKKLEKLVHDMFETMYEAHGIGLAAPQVGILRKVIVVDTTEPDEKFALVNPKIIWQSQEMDLMKEGCLSIPGVDGEVSRPAGIRVKAQAVDGEEFELAASGLLARCIQHEMDHLNGILFVDHLRESERASVARALQELAVA